MIIFEASTLGCFANQGCVFEEYVRTCGNVASVLVEHARSVVIEHPGSTGASFNRTEDLACVQSEPFGEARASAATTNWLVARSWLTIL